MSTDGAVAWLRRAVLARLEMARKADTGERWEADRRYGAAWDVDLKPSLGPVASPESGWEASLGIENCDDFENPRFLAMFILHAQHVAANDPRQIIADCESDLTILDLHVPANPAEDYDHPDWLECAECGPNSPGGNFMAAPGDGDTWWPCRTIHLLASGYRYRLGYAEHWGNGG